MAIASTEKRKKSKEKSHDKLSCHKLTKVNITKLNSYLFFSVFLFIFFVKFFGCFCFSLRWFAQERNRHNIIFKYENPLNRDLILYIYVTVVTVCCDEMSTAYMRQLCVTFFLLFVRVLVLVFGLAFSLLHHILNVESKFNANLPKIEN